MVNKKAKLDSLTSALLGSSVDKTGSQEAKAASSPSSPTSEGAKKATFVLSVDTLDKLNYISLMTGVTLKTIVQTALDDMVKSYEKRYGEIHIEKRRLNHGKL